MHRGTLIFIIVLIIATLGAVIYIKNPKPYKIAWANYVLDNREHYIDCSDLPFYPQVEKTMQQHQDVVERLKQIDGIVSVQPQQVKCPTFDGKNYFNKGDIAIEYGTRQARKAAEKAIGDNFFGIPWRGYNR